MDNLRAVLKFSAFLFFCVVLVPPQLLILLFTKKKPAYVLPHLWHRLICSVFQLKVELNHHPVREQQILYISNHVSYLDIPVISSVLPVSFVAKEDVADWPLFGLLAKLQRTAFINRARHSVQKSKDNLQNRLRTGDSVIIFPEGTSSDGKTVLPFKSSLFSAVFDPEIKDTLMIQPFTIELVETNDQKVTSQKQRDLYAWHGDMTLMPHFWNFAKSRGAKVKLHFHVPVQVKETDDRKSLAKSCYEEVATVLNNQRAVAA